MPKYEKITTQRFIAELSNLTVDAPTYEIAFIALRLQAAISEFELSCNGTLRNKIVMPIVAVQQ